MPEQPHSITIHSKLTRKDLYWVTVRILLRKLWFLAAILVLLVVVFAMAFLPQATADQKIKIVDLFASFFPYLAAAYLLVVFVVPFFSSRSQLKSSRTLQGDITYTFSAEGYGIQTLMSTSMCQWAVIFRARETKSFLILYPNKVIGIIIPKRDIPNEATLAQLRKVIRENVKGKVKLLG